MPEGGDLWWFAWRELRSERDFGAFGGCGPIRWSAVDGFARRYGIEGEDFEDLRAVLKALDGVYLEWSAAQAKARQEEAERERRGRR